MKILILGGFLGSGKTSLLLQRAYYLTGRSAHDPEYKVVILENEGGEEGIDDKLLRGNGYRVENLFSGCACCTLSGELLTAVHNIQEQMKPDWLILETTGLAYPHLIQKNLADSMHLTSRICVVTDASRWEHLLTPLHQLISGQLTNADTVLVNKTDLVTSDLLNKMEQQISEINPHPKIFQTSANQPVSHSIWDFVLGVI